jgi:hypothetical protein
VLGGGRIERRIKERNMIDDRPIWFSRKLVFDLEAKKFQWCWGLIVNCYSVDGFEASLYMDICEIHRVSCGKS